MSRGVPLCSVTNCPNGDRHKVSSTVFYFVPKELARASEWANALTGRTYAEVALKEMLICRNHFNHDAFESDSKRLKKDVIPSIFPSVQRQIKSNSNTALCKVKHESVEPLVKKLKVTNPSLLKTKESEDPDLNSKLLAHKHIITNKFDGLIGRSDNTFTPNEIKIEAKPGPSTGSQISTSTNKTECFLQTRKVQTPYEHLNIDSPIYPWTNATISSNPTSTVDDSEADDLDIKQEIVDMNSNDDDVLTLQSLKQRLNDEYEVLQKQNEDVSLKLQEVIKKRKEMIKSFANQELEVLKKCFSAGQIRILTGQNKSRWSLDDLAMAYTISSLGSRDFYTYLRSRLKYPLPALSNISRCYKGRYRTKNSNGNTSQNTDT